MQKDIKKTRNDTYKMVLVGTGLTGFVTVLILGTALALGFWLDKTFESAKHLFTIGLVILSVPLNIVGLLWVVRFTSSRYRTTLKDDAQEETLQEDANSVGN
jgi:hypothetical protein